MLDQRRSGATLFTSLPRRVKRGAPDSKSIAVNPWCASKRSKFSYMGRASPLPTDICARKALIKISAYPVALAHKCLRAGLPWRKSLKRLAGGGRTRRNGGGKSDDKGRERGAVRRIGEKRRNRQGGETTTERVKTERT